MKAPDAADPDSMSRIELVSSYVNEYATLDEDARERLEASFRRRGLPVPDMSRRRRPSGPGRAKLAARPEGRATPAARPEGRATPAARPEGRGHAVDREILLSYILLIYTVTALFYSWYYVAERLVRRDFRACPRHRIIQTAISVFYIAADILILGLVAGE